MISTSQIPTLEFKLFKEGKHNHTGIKSVFKKGSTIEYQVMPPSLSFPYSNSLASQVDVQARGEMKTK